jgi:hypothetical protein
MPQKPKEITALSLQTFLKSNVICVLKANAGIGNSFNQFLLQQLESDYPNQINVGWVDLKKLSYRSKIIQEFAKVWLPNIGLSNNDTILPGYYLFKKGKLIAFHPGTLDLQNIDPAMAKFTLVSGSIAGLIVGLVERDGVKGLKTFLDILDMPTAFKVLDFFKQSLGSQNSTYSQYQQRVVYEDELTKAYKLLDVSPGATDDEVKKAYRKAILKYHPDKDHNDKEGRTKMTAEINNAYDLIKKERVKAKQSTI